MSALSRISTSRLVLVLPLVFVPVLVAVLVPARAHAATIRVPADQPTIQAGIDAAATGDEVLVAAGTYTGPGNRDLDFAGKALALRSESGAQATVIDCQSQGRGVWLHSGEPSTAIIEGFTVTGGLASEGGAMLLEGASPTVRSCIFTLNYSADRGGGAISSQGGSPVFSDCQFTGNVGDHGVGGAVLLDGGAMNFTRCEFRRNNGTFQGGAFYVQSATVMLAECILDRNGTIGYGGALLAKATTLTLDHCTLHANAASFGGGGGGLSLDDASTATITNTIIAFSTDGEAVNCRDGSSATLSCSDVFGNADGDWTSCLAGQQGQNDNLALDPLFCDAANGDLSLNAASPCQPANAPGGCGLIGALGVGCGTAAIPDPDATPLAPSTWGAIKARNR